MRAPTVWQELYDEAKKRDLPGRSKMGRDEPARALGHDRPPPGELAGKNREALDVLAPTRKSMEGARMATLTLTKDNFDEVVSGNDLVLIDFWAEWCGPCRQFGPVFERVSDEHTDIVFAKVDTEAQQELAAAFGISSIPTLMVIRDKVVLHQQAGALPQAALNELVGAARAVDMADVHRQMAAQAEAGDAQA